MSLPELPHAFPECSGYWKLIGVAPHQQIMCSHCRHQYDATTANKLIMNRENYIDGQIYSLAREGKYVLKREREPWRDE